ncbi:glycosyltransferase family 4 protein [Pirellulimonas nuda]|uniref:glycosyltransferase family 4 protein n=1 Tax=Pirellulimonas nuda TaxID=2528009 RepID=UPI0018D2C969|nr:glycosyltransferase [Pirellulimonas nuda]
MLIVTENASQRHGGESILPLHWFLGLLRANVDVRLLMHARHEREVVELLGENAFRVHFVPDTLSQKILWTLSRPLPHNVKVFTTVWFMHLITQFTQRRVARRMIAQHQINVVHEPIPVSPRLPSMMYDLGAPVVIGPMNGNMSYPPGSRRPLFQEPIFRPLARSFTSLANWLIPGKRRSALLLVANERTRQGLPRNCSARVETLVENGVDPEVWRRPDDLPTRPDGVLRLGFSGRLLDWKGVDVVLAVLAELRKQSPAVELWIVGDGPERKRLGRQAEHLGLVGAVTFHGWVGQNECARLLSQCDVFVYPSVMDCGGAVVLEAMSLGLPVVALNWGGPADYVRPPFGVAIDPAPRRQVIAEMVKAIQSLTPEKRRRMGAAAQKEIADHYAWPAKIQEILAKYKDACGADTHTPKAEGTAESLCVESSPSA